MVIEREKIEYVVRGVLLKKLQSNINILLIVISLSEDGNEHFNAFIFSHLNARYKMC